MNERFARAASIARVVLAHEPEFALGGVRLRSAHCEIVGPGWSEILEPRVMQVLVALARANGEVVSRDDLIESCWEGRVVGEDAIGRCIGRLRRLADASNGAFTVETVSRVGYRLKTREAPALVTFNPAPVRESASPPVSIAGAPAENSPTMRFRRATGLALLCVVVGTGVLVAGIAVWWFLPKPAVVSAEPATSVAVLPFANMSGDPAKEYFSDGFSEEVLDDLSNDPRLRVVARTSAFAFKGKSGDIRTIARALSVRAIVEGSVREAGNRVRITAELIDAVSGYRIWSARYDRELSDILRVQDEVARTIAVAMTHKILPNVAPRPGKIDPAVYRMYLEARNQLDSYSEDGYKKGFALLRQVTAKQPDFAEGWAEFSRAAWMVGQVDALHQDSTEALAHEAAGRALVLDPHNLSARKMQALLELDDWDWSAAESHIRTLRAENPNNWRLTGVGKNFYEYLGFTDEADKALRHAETLNPLYDGTKKLIFNDLTIAGRYREAIGVARAILGHSPDDTSTLEKLCQDYAGTGQIHAAREIGEHLRRLKSDQLQSCQFHIDVAAGDFAAARTILNNWITDFPDKFPDEVQEASDIAESYVELNDFDRASDWYERAYDRHETMLFWFTSHIGDAKYRQTAGFKTLSQRPGFKAWQAEHDKIAAELAAHHGAP